MYIQKCIQLKNEYQDCKIINIDGYFVQCVDANKVAYIEVIFQEGNSQQILNLEATTTSACAKFLCPIAGETEIIYHTYRMGKTIQLTQFSLNIANARTVHKLQGRSLENLLVSNWSYATN